MDRLSLEMMKEGRKETGWYQKLLLHLEALLLTLCGTEGHCKIFAGRGTLLGFTSTDFSPNRKVFDKLLQLCSSKAKALGKGLKTHNAVAEFERKNK